MAILAQLKYKLTTGEVVLVGDVGKTRVRQPPVDINNPDAYEPGYLYGVEFKDTDTPEISGFIGEINDIQVDPAARPTADTVKAGQTIVYSEGDLL